VENQKRLLGAASFGKVLNRLFCYFFSCHHFLLFYLLIYLYSQR
jgi:hypothetical protein